MRTRALPPSPTLSPTDPVPRGLLTLWASRRVPLRREARKDWAKARQSKTKPLAGASSRSLSQEPLAGASRRSLSQEPLAGASRRSL